ncbi:tRNA (5-methylaminomethyl-2-thiouridine)(34)-methyltransferase MnmD [Spirosoma luteolum]
MSTGVEVVMTADGSNTVLNQALGKTYHSVYGAWQESQRVYIEIGLLEAFDRFTGAIRILEMGFGTGLNALLTLREAERRSRTIRYVGLDSFPLPLEQAQQLNYDGLLQTTQLAALHEAPWEVPVSVTPSFTLQKHAVRLEAFATTEQFHLIYYDAFAPSSQPELWESDIFEKLAGFLLPGGMLTTYCSKSYVQRNMRSAGLVVEKHDGPHHKRDILRAIRPA